VGVGSGGRKLDYWGGALEQDIGTPTLPVTLCFPPPRDEQVLLYHVLSTVMFFLTTGPNAVEPIDNGITSLKP
jgi:hypothetical protein